MATSLTRPFHSLFPLLLLATFTLTACSDTTEHPNPASPPPAEARAPEPQPGYGTCDFDSTVLSDVTLKESKEEYTLTYTGVTASEFDWIRFEATLYSDADEATEYRTMAIQYAGDGDLILATWLDGKGGTENVVAPATLPDGTLTVTFPKSTPLLSGFTAEKWAPSVETSDGVSPLSDLIYCTNKAQLPYTPLENE